jgi:outer membrane protein assembly factor BamB
MKSIFQAAIVFIIITVCFTHFTTERSWAASRSYTSNTMTNVILWEFKTKGVIYSTPIIDNGVAYIGSLDSCFYAIDVSTGTEKWHYKAHDQIFSTAIKYDTILCFESGNVLYGLNLQGALSWKYKMYDSTILNKHDEWDYYHSSPLLLGNIIYIGTEKGLVYGIDVRDGSKIFQCQTPTANYTIETTPAVYDNKIYFGDWNGVFYSYDLSNGNLVWQYDTKVDNSYTGWVNAIVTDPVIYRDAVYFGGRSCNFYCMDAKTGVKKWMYHDGGNMWLIGGPTLADSVLYLGSSYQHVVRAFDALTGAVKWDKSVEYRVNGKPMIDGNFMYVGTEGDTDEKVGTLCALNKIDGTMKAKLRVGTQIYSTPVLSQGTIFFGGSNGSIYAVSQEELFNITYPNMHLSCPDTLNFGSLQKNSTNFTSEIYVYNLGEVPDSITITSYSSAQVKVQPTGLTIAPYDSQKVTFTIDPSSLSIKTYKGYISFTSQWALIPLTTRKLVLFKVQPASGIKSESTIPKNFSLNQNYPNPFNPATIISYCLANTGHVSLKVFDMLGRELATLIDRIQSSGYNSVTFDGSNLPSGMYFYRLQTGSYTAIRKLTLLK